MQCPKHAGWMLNRFNPEMLGCRLSLIKIIQIQHHGYKTNDLFDGRRPSDLLFNDGPNHSTFQFVKYDIKELRNMTQRLAFILNFSWFTC